MSKTEPKAANQEYLKKAPGQREKNEDKIENLKTDDYDYLANSATTMDCTGLMNRAPVDETEMSSYQQIYQYLPTNVKLEESN